MVKKIIAGSLFAIFAGVLLYGLINYTRATDDSGCSEHGEGEMGSGHAEARLWVTLAATAQDVTAEILTVTLEDGSQLLIEGRTWQYAQEQGFSTQVGNDLQLRGFYEGDAFEVGGFTDETTGLEVTVREETGRPLWAGSGGGHSGGDE